MARREASFMASHTASSTVGAEASERVFVLALSIICDLRVTYQFDQVK